MPIFGKKKKEPVEEITQEKQERAAAPQTIFEKNIAVDKLMKAVQGYNALDVTKKSEQKKYPDEHAQKMLEKIPEAIPEAKRVEIPRMFQAEPRMQSEPKLIAVKKIEQEPEYEDEETEAPEEAAHFAPLFVKIDRYREILNSMNSIKNTLTMIKNTFSVMSELDKLRAENSRVIQEAIDKVDKKILTLDSEFLRPSGFIEDAPELHDIHGLQSTIMDLRSQIDQMKSELRELH
jgi:hypothetical protein